MAELNTLSLKELTSLKAYYQFSSGALTTDSSGNSHTLTAISGPAEDASGKYGGAVALDGDDAYSATDHADLKPAGTFSVSVWVKINTVSAVNCIAQSYSENSNPAGWQFNLDSTGKIQVYLGKNSGTSAGTDYINIVGTAEVDNNAWRHLVVVHDAAADTTKFYIDGSLDKTQTSSTIDPVYAATNYVRVGCRNHSGTNIGFFNGSIDDLAVFSGKALGSGEIALLYEASTKNLETLVVGGGGGGGATEANGYGAGGGGAGGIRHISSTPVAIGIYPVVVGGGGGGSSNVNSRGVSGSDSIFCGITGTGGGGGGSNGDAEGARTGQNGGSGGGGSGKSSSAGGSGNVPSKTPVQGYGGGTGRSAAQYGGGGGGGAGEVGMTATADANGNGGDGYACSITGSSVTFAGGGGGGGFNNAATLGEGGEGGGGNGSRTSGNGSNATANTGGGGGGGGCTAIAGGNGGNGGSGIVVIRYLSSMITATGGTETTDGAYTIRTFTSSGNFEVTEIFDISGVSGYKTLLGVGQA